MSVTAVNPISAVASEADDGTIEYDVVMEAITNSSSDGPRTVLSSALVPKRGDTFSFSGDTDQFASLRSRSISYRGKDETRKVWTLNLKYSSRGSSQNPSDQSGGPADPIDWSWKVAGRTWNRIEAPDADRNDRPFVNIVGEPFLPPPERENPDPLIVLTKNHPTLDLSAWCEVQGKVNSNTQWGLTARKVKLREWTWTQHWIGQDRMYFSNTIEVEIKFAGFYYEPCNLGHRELIGIDPATGAGIYRNIVDEMKMPVARPVPLDAAGQRLPFGFPPVFFDQAAGAGGLQRFEIEDETDLSGVLPNVLPGNFTGI